MNNFIDSLRKALIPENWYAVLFISLTLPDICGKIDEPDKGSKARTINWFNKYLAPIYTVKIGPERIEHIFLTGGDFYALRCAYLHEGSDEIVNQKAQEILHRFKFIQPLTPNINIHRNAFNGNILQLQVSEFGKEILNAVEKWLVDISTDADKINKLKNFLNIELIDFSKGFTL